MALGCVGWDVYVCAHGDPVVCNGAGLRRRKDQAPGPDLPLLQHSGENMRILHLNSAFQVIMKVYLSRWEDRVAFVS